MKEDYIIKLTLLVYQTSEGWSEEDPIRFHIRRKAGEVLKDFILATSSNPALSEKKAALEGLNEMIDIIRWARRDKKVTRKEFISLRDGYKEAGETFSVPSGAETRKKEKKVLKKEKKRSYTLKKRERKIIAVLDREKRAQVSELKEYFPEISKRTLRRDIDGLLEKGLIIRKGEWNNVFYTLS